MCSLILAHCGWCPPKISTTSFRWGRVKDEVEIFFFTPILLYSLNDYWFLGILKLFKELIFLNLLPQIVARPAPFSGQIEPKFVHSGHILVQYGHILNLHLLTSTLIQDDIVILQQILSQLIFITDNRILFFTLEPDIIFAWSSKAPSC